MERKIPSDGVKLRLKFRFGKYKQVNICIYLWLSITQELSCKQIASHIGILQR